MAELDCVLYEAELPWEWWLLVISREEALRRARAWAAAGHGGAPVKVALYTFDLGYVAWVVEPPRIDPSRPPSSTGAPKVVIDGETGELTQWPSLPVQVIASQYAAYAAAQDRFPPDVRRVFGRLREQIPEPVTNLPASGASRLPWYMARIAAATCGSGSGQDCGCIDTTHSDPQRNHNKINNQHDPIRWNHRSY